MAEGQRNQSYAALRAVLPTVRDRLTVDVAAQRAARLPRLTRVISCERAESEQRAPQDEHARRRRARPARVSVQHQPERAPVFVHGVVTASRNHLGGREWDDVVAILPRELRSVLASP